MRSFTDLITMTEEIRRDLYKSPVIVSSRVQATEVEIKGHEAMNYSYSVPASAFPDDTYELAKFGARYFESWEEIARMVAWLSMEGASRANPLVKTSRYSGPSDSHHPLLRGQVEGRHYSYTYRERMIGMLPAMESVLAKDLYSRRAYWPIFEQRDSHRASDFTRIPCSLGYHFAVRGISLKEPQLHVTNLQRSCHFSTFWLSDLWFTYQAQRLLAERLNIECGLIHHHIVSFHDFIEGEIY